MKQHVQRFWTWFNEPWPGAFNFSAAGGNYDTHAEADMRKGKKANDTEDKEMHFEE